MITETDAMPGSGGGGAASEITVADAAGDTTTFLVLVGAATGDQAPLTDAGAAYDAATNTAGSLNIGGNAASADISYGVSPTYDNTTDSDYYIPFLFGFTLYYDNGIAYNPGQKKLKSNLFSTSASASTGTAVIIDGSNILRPLTSSLRFKENVAELSPVAFSLTAFLGLSPIRFDYKDQFRTVKEVVERKNPTTGLMEEETIYEGEDLPGIKGVLGFSAEAMHDAGLNDLVNYDKDGLPYSLRDHGIMAYMHAALVNMKAELDELRAMVKTLSK